ncbi:hypothetical protein SAMN05443247_07042 [Bradyrhizobium erythrophlei]|jgi:hypothetical protein|nr:hypothetical protein SAMN05443247_07042 [Bradyrhizobium erythrophlei]
MRSKNYDDDYCTHGQLRKTDFNRGVPWVDLNQRSNDTGRNAAAAGWSLLAELVPKSSSGAGGTRFFRQPWKDNNHVTSNDLLVGCIGHHRHRVHCYDFNRCVRISRWARRCWPRWRSSRQRLSRRCLPWRCLPWRSRTPWSGGRRRRCCRRCCCLRSLRGLRNTLRILSQPTLLLKPKLGSGGRRRPAASRLWRAEVRGAQYRTALPALPAKPRGLRSPPVPLARRAALGMGQQETPWLNRNRTLISPQPPPRRSRAVLGVVVTRSAPSELVWA